MSLLSTIAQHPAAFIIFGVATFLALMLSLLFGVRARPQGRNGPVDDPAMLAMLAGGHHRLADMHVTALLSRNALSFSGRSKLVVTNAGAATSDVERRLLAQGGKAGFGTWAALVAEEAKVLKRTMVSRGLMADADDEQSLRRAQVLPLLPLVGLAGLLLLVSIAAGASATGWAIALVAASGITAIRWFGIDPRTRGGLDALTKAQRSHERLRRAPVREEMALGVALFGTTILAGSEFDAYHQMRNSSSDGGGGSDSSSGDSGCSGGGCGGGGCGS